MKTILITGVSSGIGAASAAAFLERGYRVVGTIRKEGDADDLVRASAGRFYPIFLEVTNRDEIETLGRRVGAILGNDGLDGWMNNAGIATVGSLVDQPYEEYVRQFQVNVFSPVLILRQLLPFLVKAKGRVLQIGSVAGELTFPFLSAYAASKHAMEAQSDGMRRELRTLGIDVVHFQFGSVKTPIWGKFSPEIRQIMARSAWSEPFGKFADSMAGRGNDGIEPAQAARTIVRVFESKRPRARYAVLKNKFANWTLPRLMSDRALDSAIAKALGLDPKRS